MEENIFLFAMYCEIRFKDIESFEYSKYPKEEGCKINVVLK